MTLNACWWEFVDFNPNRRWPKRELQPWEKQIREFDKDIRRRMGEIRFFEKTGWNVEKASKDTTFKGSHPDIVLWRKQYKPSRFLPIEMLSPKKQRWRLYMRAYARKYNQYGKKHPNQRFYRTRLRIEEGSVS